MASYFDHFIITKLLNSYITDSFVIIVFVIIMYMILNHVNFVIPNRFQLISETIIDHWGTVVKENLGNKSEFYILPLTSLFMFILGMNLLGFFTYTFPVTTHIFVTFGMAFII